MTGSDFSYTTHLLVALSLLLGELVLDLLAVALGE
jgi:hypothetical protein